MRIFKGEFNANFMKGQLSNLQASKEIRFYLSNTILSPANHSSILQTILFERCC